MTAWSPHFSVNSPERTDSEISCSLALVSDKHVTTWSPQFAVLTVRNEQLPEISYDLRRSSEESDFCLVGKRESK